MFGGTGLRWVKCEICTESFVEDIPKRHKYSQRHKRCGIVKLEIDELDKKIEHMRFKIDEIIDKGDPKGDDNKELHTLINKVAYNITTREACTSFIKGYNEIKKDDTGAFFHRLMTRVQINFFI